MATLASDEWSGCHEIFETDHFIWFGSFNNITVLVEMASVYKSGYDSPAKYSSNISFWLFCLMHSIAAFEVFYTAVVNPRVWSLSNLFLYFATSAGSEGSYSLGQPPCKCFIPLF